MSDAPRDELARFLRDDLQRAATETEPIADDQLEAYVDGTLDAVDREIVETRLEDDPALRVQVDDLRALRAALAASTPVAPAAAVSLDAYRGRAGARRWLVPVGLAAAALVAFLIWRAARVVPDGPSQAHAPASQPMTGGGGNTAPSAPTLTVSLQDRGRTVALTADGRLLGVTGLAADTAATLAASLRDGRLPASPLGARVAAGAGVLMSDAAATPNASFVPRSPVATAVADPRPTFRWTGLGGASGYRVRIVDDSLAAIVVSPTIDAVTWRPASPLPAGRVLLWQIEADTADGLRTTPAPPLPEARFAVLPAADAARIEAATVSAGSDLAVAVIAAEAGLYVDAEAALARVAAANPGSPIVAALRTDLAAKRR